MAQHILRSIGQTPLSLCYLVRGSAVGDGGALFSLELLRPELAQDEALRATFLEEAALGRHLGHPNLVGTRALVSDETGFGRTTEWCDGQPLSRVLERVGRASLPLRLQVWIQCQILSALEHAHHFFEHSFEHSGGPDGLLHGSISPESVLLGYDGQVRLLGMGFPRSRGALERRLGQLLIESCYAAPERYVGSLPTRTEDLYGVGAMLWEALTEMHRALASSLVDVSQPRSNDETPSAEELCPEAPEPLTRVCQRALGAAPAERYPDAFEMRTELEAFLAATSSAAEPEPGPAVLAELLHRHFAAERIDFESLGEPPRAEDSLEPRVDDASQPGLLRFAADGRDDGTHTVTSFDEPILTDTAPLGAEAEQEEPERIGAETVQPERSRRWPGTSRRELALTREADPAAIVAAWRARRKLERGQLSGASRGPLSREAWRVSGTVIGVVGIALLFAIARYGVPGARGSHSSAPPSGEASRGNSSEPSAPSLRSALLPALPLAAPSGTSSRPVTEPIASSLTAPDADSPREPETPAAVPEPDGEDAVDHFHPRYLRAEDVAQLREIDDPKSPPHPRASRVSRRQPNWKTRFEKILRSATPAGATVREPRRIDEEDPYSP